MYVGICMYACMYIYHIVLDHVVTGGLSDYDFAVANEAVLSMLSLSMCICDYIYRIHFWGWSVQTCTFNILIVAQCSKVQIRRYLQAKDLFLLETRC